MMFIELTTLSGTKIIVNTSDISSVKADVTGVRITWLSGQGAAIYKEDYEDVKKLLNAKWVAE